MSDQHALPEALLTKRGDNFRRNPSQIAILIAVSGAKQQRHQRRPRLLNLQSKLPRQIVTKRTRPHLRDRKSTRRHPQRRRAKFIARSANRELIRPLNLLDANIKVYFHAGRPALSFEYVRDFIPRTVAEK